MKVLLFLTTVLFFSNCNEKETTKNQKEIAPSTPNLNLKTLFFSGTISKLEATTFQYGTHLLKGNIIDGNEKNVGIEIPFALKSDSINLDSFINKKVIITSTKMAGYPVENGPDYLEVQTIELDGETHANQSH